MQAVAVLAENEVREQCGTAPNGPSFTCLRRNGTTRVLYYYVHASLSIKVLDVFARSASHGSCSRFRLSVLVAARSRLGKQDEGQPYLRFCIDHHSLQNRGLSTMIRAIAPIRCHSHFALRSQDWSRVRFATAARIPIRSVPFRRFSQSPTWRQRTSAPDHRGKAQDAGNTSGVDAAESVRLESFKKPGEASANNAPNTDNLLSEQTVSNKEQRKADWAIIKEMAQYLWPKVGFRAQDRALHF